MTNRNIYIFVDSVALLLMTSLFIPWDFYMCIQSIWSLPPSTSPTSITHSLHHIFLRTSCSVYFNENCTGWYKLEEWTFSTSSEKSGKCYLTCFSKWIKTCAPLWLRFPEGISYIPELMTRKALYDSLLILLWNHPLMYIFLECGY